MAIKELEILIADLTKNVEKLTKDVEKLTHHSVRQFDLLHNDNEKLAVASQQEFEGIQIEFRAMQSKMEAMAHGIENIDLHLSAHVAPIREDYDALHNWIKQVDDRVQFLEKTNPASS